MQPSCDPLHSWDRERSNTLAMNQRCAHKGLRHPFFLHSAALAITSPPHEAHSLGVFPKEEASVFATSELSAPCEGRSRLGQNNLPRIRSSSIIVPPSSPLGVPTSLPCPARPGDGCAPPVLAC